MGKVHRLPSTDDAEREASTWFARMNADDVTADDRARFEAWLRAQCSECEGLCRAFRHLAGTREIRSSGPGRLFRSSDECGRVAACARAGAGRLPPWPPESAPWCSA